MLDRLEKIEKRYQELGNRMAQPEIATDYEQVQKLARERAGIETVALKYNEYKQTANEITSTTTMLDDGLEPEMVALIKEELQNLQVKKQKLWKEIQTLLLPKDPNDDKDVILEIRAGTGGEEASLFAADLYRMYVRYGQGRRWNVDLIDSSPSESGGFKEIIFEIKGKGAFSRLKYERGVHRVQRIPVTESSGRIHTSTATVAVLPEAEEIDIDIRPDDIKMEFYHSSGAGGQNVNKVSSAVRLIHVPTGMVVTCQDERSQLKNRMKALAVLRARLFAQKQQKQQEELVQERRSQVGTGERAEKIRTYNYPQNRITDHRVDLNLYNLEAILDGALDELIEPLSQSEQSEKLGQLA